MIWPNCVFFQADYDEIELQKN